MVAEKSVNSSKNLLALMQGAGRSIVDKTATADSFTKHTEEIISTGYDGHIHSDFSRFLCNNFSLAKGDKVIWVGEILADWVVLETARYFTAEDNLWNGGYSRISKGDFLDALPFQPPVFHLKLNSSRYPSEAVSRTFWCLPLGKVENLVLSGRYDDIFNAILLWRSNYKEPFHNYRYGLHVRSVDDYINCYLREILNVNLDRKTDDIDVAINNCLKVATRFFSKEENVKKFFYQQKNILLEKIQISKQLEKQARAVKAQEEKEREQITREHEENRKRKLAKPATGQKQRLIVLEMLDEKTYGNVTAVGNRAAWLCPCGNKSPLIGRTYGVLPESDKIVICPSCQKHYHLPPLRGKPNKPPEKIVEIDADSVAIMQKTVDEP